MVGLVLKATNEMHQVDYDPPHYDVIKKAVGGWHEHVHPVMLRPPYCMMVNEEGLLMKLPINQIASYLYGTQSHGAPIVGDVIFLKDGYHNGEPDVVGMTADDAQRLGNQLITLSGGVVRWAIERRYHHDQKPQ